jgi:hypothetical protein
MISIRIQKEKHQIGNFYRVFCLVRDEWTGDGTNKLTPIVVIAGHLPALDNHYTRFTLKFKESSSGNLIMYEILDVRKTEHQRIAESCKRRRVPTDLPIRIIRKMVDRRFS